MCVIWKRHGNVTRVSSLSARVFHSRPDAIARYVTRKTHDV